MQEGSDFRNRPTSRTSKIYGPSGFLGTCCLVEGEQLLTIAIGYVNGVCTYGSLAGPVRAAAHVVSG